MAGYIGSKASVTQVDGYNRTEADAEFVNDPDGTITVSSGNVGIGTSSPAQKLDVTGNTSSTQARFGGTAGRGLEISTATTFSTPDAVAVLNAPTSTYGTMIFQTQSTERMRIDSSGNVLVGTTTSSGLGNSSSPEGISISSSQRQIVVGTSSDVSLYLNRQTTDGTIQEFRKDGTTVGSIGTLVSDLTIGDGDTGVRFASGSDAIIPHNMATNAGRDNAIDLGFSSVRFDDVYATNGTIQTSDRNEKQDIDVLSDAEQRVAVACKGLLRKFRWKDAVAEKGDAARIHFGIIAQDLQDAFAAEGLDAGDYAMFISSTWWEADETYTDDDGVEQTRTQHYNTADEAPDGAIEKTRLGVRYPELLAFIIGAL